MIAQPIQTPAGWRRRERIRESLFKVIGVSVLLFAMMALTALLVNILLDGFQRLGFDFLSNYASRRAAQAGVKAALVGSLWMAVLTAMIAVPIGIGAALYLEEFSRKGGWARFIEINIANLAGVPSVIYGLLGLQVFVRVFGFGESLLAGACTLALLVLPVIITAAREALRTVPQNIREGSLALGATGWQTVRFSVLPVAFPSMLTGVILALSRAVGETAPLIVVGAAAYIASLPSGALSSYTVLPIQIYDWVSRPQQAFHQNAAAAIIVLLVMLLSLNAIAIWLRNRFQKRLAI